MALKCGHFGKSIRSTWKVLKFGVGEEWRRLGGPIVNCLLKHVIEEKLEGRIEITGRRGRRRKQLLDDLRETRGYWELKEEALDRTL
ncbi:hypothetical protein Cfor_05823 [Coptotermes formosanus]|uniref:Uncharacterized protein n=1 Tax=Coptotermes formosanus TaxID=36987 RepID=A0A6L2PKB2_COPFO|nr:hypothetical protein Cfor_05823 [Coptotermes formosanus]